MKKGELMLGDYVMLNDTLYRIEELSQEGWVHLVDSQGVRAHMTSDFVLEMLKPIPLTDDILHQIGFMQHYDVWYLYIDKFISISHTITSEVVYHPDSIVVVSSPTCRLENNNCKYVHELQHILRACDLFADYVITLENKEK